jgi:hypothetical protein
MVAAAPKVLGSLYVNAGETDGCARPPDSRRRMTTRGHSTIDIPTKAECCRKIMMYHLRGLSISFFCEMPGALYGCINPMHLGDAAKQECCCPTATITYRCNTVLPLILREHMHQRHCNSRPTAAKRVPERDRTSAHVEPLRADE